MGIELAGKSLDNLVIRPLSLGEERLQIEPNSNNELYDCNGLHFHYQVLSDIRKSNNYDQYISSSIGRCHSPVHVFRDSHGTTQKYTYQAISIWDAVLEEHRDIIFMHELVELRHIVKGIPKSEAHELAVVAEEAYMKKHLSQEEQYKFIIRISSLKAYH